MWIYSFVGFEQLFFSFFFLHKIDTYIVKRYAGKKAKLFSILILLYVNSLDSSSWRESEQREKKFHFRTDVCLIILEIEKTHCRHFCCAENNDDIHSNELNEAIMSSKNRKEFIWLREGGLAERLTNL